MTVTAYTKAAVDTQLAAKLDTTAAPELIRDTIGTALVAGSNVTVTPNDAGDTITVAAADSLRILVYSGSAYPARPGGLAGGQVRYIGPVQPTDWLANDEWVNNS